jgi:RNA polymerase sigma factor (sigma-70 family)
MPRDSARIIVHPSAIRNLAKTEPPRKSEAVEQPIFVQVADGSPEAIAEVTALVARIVQFRGFFIPFDDRPDVIHEAMVDMLRAVADSRFVTDDQFFGFVRVVTYRRCIDWVREKRRMDRVRRKPAELADPQEQLLAREKRELGSRVVRRMRKPCRDLFGMHAGLGMTYGQMSELMDRSEGAIRSQAYECLKQARKMLMILRRQR